MVSEIWPICACGGGGGGVFHQISGTGSGKSGSNWIQGIKMLLASVVIEVECYKDASFSVWGKYAKRRKCRMWCDIWTEISEKAIEKICVGWGKRLICTEYWEGISISMIRLCTDISTICNGKPCISAAGSHSRAIFVLSREILL